MSEYRGELMDQLHAFLIRVRATSLARLRTTGVRQVKRSARWQLRHGWLREVGLRSIWLKLLLPLFALVLLVIGLLGPQLQLDVLLFVLLIVATVPWLWPHIQSRVASGTLHAELEVMRARQEQQQVEVDRLTIFLLHHCLTGCEFEHLHKLAASGPFLVGRSWLTERSIAELRRLCALGFVDRIAGHGFRTLLEQIQGQKQEVDVKEHFFATEQGKKYLTLLQSEMATFLSDS